MYVHIHIYVLFHNINVIYYSIIKLLTLIIVFIAIKHAQLNLNTEIYIEYRKLN